MTKKNKLPIKHRIVKISRTIRGLSEEEPKIKRLHEKWCSENEDILIRYKNEWNIGIVVRNHARDFIDKLLKFI